MHCQCNEGNSIAFVHILVAEPDQASAIQTRKTILIDMQLAQRAIRDDTTEGEAHSDFSSRLLTTHKTDISFITN